MTIQVHYLQPPAAEHLDLLISLLDPAVNLTTGQDLTHGQNLTYDQDVPASPDTDILIAGRPSRDDLVTRPSLRALIVPWAGLPPETRSLMAAFPGISVHNLHHNAQPVAELVLTLLLSAAKLVVPLDRKLRQNDWTPRYRPGQAQLLAGKTALILGYGAIGRQTAVLCKALGMRVLATRRRPTPEPDGPADEIHPATELQALLPLADALLICLPHTPETDGLIGQRKLALLPAGAILVNVGRGPIVDEAALYLALQSGHLHGAGLDVWYNYPRDEASRSRTPPATYPFRELANVVMSPHRAGSTLQTNTLRMAHLAELLNAAAAGEEIPNRIDLTAGY